VISRYRESFSQNSKNMTLHVITMSCPTSHGGVVISGSPTRYVGGMPVARMGDFVNCPMRYPNGQPHGVNPIIEGHGSFLVNGRPVALVGHKTQCGCVLMPRPTVRQSTNESDAQPYDYLRWAGVKETDLSSQPESTHTIGIYQVAGWSGSSPYMDGIIASPEIQKAIAQAWFASDPMSATNRHEEGFWVVRNKDGTYKAVPFPKGKTGSIDPPIQPPPDTVTFFHTHPNSVAQGYLPWPSNNDMAFARYYHMPGFLASQSGLYIFPGA
jgi:uncharacterized Zn-binding protein involved in type VI secretion